MAEWRSELGGSIGRLFCFIMSGHEQGTEPDTTAKACHSWLTLDKDVCSWEKRLSGGEKEGFALCFLLSFYFWRGRGVFMACLLYIWMDRYHVDVASSSSSFLPACLPASLPASPSCCSPPRGKRGGGYSRDIPNSTLFFLAHD